MNSADRKLKGLLVHALDSEERFEAVQALRQLGDIRVLEPFLDFMLTDPDDDIRRESAWGVAELVRAGKIPFLQAVQTLLSALEDDDPMLRGHAVLALSRIYGQEDTEQIVAPRIIALLSDPASTVRLQAAFWMVKLGDERARAALILLLNDPDVAIRDMAERAIATLDINQGL